MFAVSKLARRCGLSRSTLLYYESIGLMKPGLRTAGNYRSYGDKDLRRLEQICNYRNAGLKLEDIRSLLETAGGNAASVLERRLRELNAEIETLRSHQRSILKLLQTSSSWRTKNMKKEKWVEIMKSAGFTEEDMHRWHAAFEQGAPEDHQEFLEFLHIPPEEIKTIRDWSRKGK